MRKGGSEFAGRIRLCWSDRERATTNNTLLYNDEVSWKLEQICCCEQHSRIWYWRRATRAGKWAHDVPMRYLGLKSAGRGGIFLFLSSGRRVEEA